MKTTMRLFGFEPYRRMIDDTLDRIQKGKVIDRIRAKDHTVWKADPHGIINRLGWLDAPRAMKGEVRRIARFVDDCRKDGFADVVLLGMGGSSLAPEVLRHTFGFRKDYLDLSILDSTDPATILSRTTNMNPARTLVLVSTKSGTTVETLSLFNLFYSIMSDEGGVDGAGDHFTAITDPGSPLVDLARRCSFRETFLNDPDTGGRYSALSFFGLVPAALTGMDISYLLIRAEAAARSFETTDDISSDRNPAAFLGAMLGSLALEGRDKLTFLISPQLKQFGIWLEQLIAESLGKEGKGIIPVVNEPFVEPETYSSDRLFLYLKLAWDRSLEERVASLEAAGHPVLTVEVQDLYEMGAQFFFWQAATAVAGHVLSVNPFDQPDVESSKELTRRFLDDYRKRGQFEAETPSGEDRGITIIGGPSGATLSEALSSFLEQAGDGSYVAILAYLQSKEDTDRALETLRETILARYRCATTLGYGPRYLHSTGQLHKGGGGKGLFIQITANDPHDMHIPGKEGVSEDNLFFGVLNDAQARGDGQALQEAGRPVLVLHLGDNIVDGLRRLAEALL